MVGWLKFNITEKIPFMVYLEIQCITFKTEKSFIAHPWIQLSVVGLEEYSAHDWRAATSVQRAPVTWREWGLCMESFETEQIVLLWKAEINSVSNSATNYTLRLPTYGSIYHKNSYGYQLFGMLHMIPRCCALLSGCDSWWRHQMETNFRVTGPLWGESTGHRWFPFATASDAELWCFHWSVFEQAVEPINEMSVILDTIAVIMTSL